MRLKTTQIMQTLTGLEKKLALEKSNSTSSNISYKLLH